MTPRAPFLTRFNSSTVGELRRVTIELDCLTIETQDLVGTYRPESQVFWDEVRAVYAWTAPDWRLITVGIIFAILAVPFGALFASALNPGDHGMTPLIDGIGAAVVVLAFFTALGVNAFPARWFRLDTELGPISFNTRRREMPEVLLSRLPLV